MEQLSGLTKGTTLMLAMYFLRMDSASLVSQQIMHVSQQTMQFCFVAVLSEGQWAKFDFCGEANACINQELDFRRA